MPEFPAPEANQPESDRRAFLKKAGQFAALVPPAMTFLLTTSLSSKAIAQSATYNKHDPTREWR
jgi:hypothetical protein